MRPVAGVATLSPAQSTALRVTGGLLLATLWEVAGRLSDSLLLPTCLDTLGALVALAASGTLWSALWSSNQTLAAGFLLAALVGVPLGLALGRWTTAGRWVDPYLRLLLVVPTTALIPILLIVGGAGAATRAAVVMIFALPIVAQYARTAVRDVDPHLREVARVFGATPAQEWRLILWPAARPGVLLGLRLGLARAVEGMVIVELLLVAVGIGGLLLDFEGRFDAPSVYAVILVVMIEAALLTQAGRAVERRFALAAPRRSREASHD